MLGQPSHLALRAQLLDDAVFGPRLVTSGPSLNGRTVSGAADARELVRLLKGIPAKINLIPFNPWPGSSHECSDWEQIETFADVVNRAGYASPIRTPRGRDILAACGQLKSESERLKIRERMALEAMIAG